MSPSTPHTLTTPLSSSPTPAHQSLNGQVLAGANSPPQPQTPSLTRLNSHHASPLSSIYPTPRPSSLPPSSSFSFPLSSPPTPTTQIPCPLSQDPLQRYSSASLPLPHQIPVHALPKSSNPMGVLIPASPGPSSSNDLSSSTHPSESRSAIRSLCLDEICLSSSSSSSASTSTAASSSSKLSLLEAAPCSPTKPSSALPSSPTASSSNDSTQPQRSVSPFRAPQPPPPSTQSSRFQSSDFATAMRRFISPSDTNNQSPSEPGQNQSSYPPPPDPPVILPAEPSDDTTQPASSTPSRAPYMPFLSHAPPPPDCWIEVETTHGEYRLNVRLPGFSRESITLATKRRRILHVVADSWENGGGHFERRISFGYDADLIQVRAEFDGVMLRIFVPRRISPVNWYSPRPGPIGRA